jgi:hypothetical protein|tara:strand:+ start:598 stop:756 length:159 start_codon:yes stop_codon:yes gene_type:complete
MLKRRMYYQSIEEIAIVKTVIVVAIVSTKMKPPQRTTRIPAAEDRMRQTREV